jgi:hypothetical protein
VLAYDPTEFTDCLRAIAEGDIDVAPMIPVRSASMGSAPRSTTWRTPTRTARSW